MIEGTIVVFYFWKDIGILKCFYLFVGNWQWQQVSVIQISQTHWACMQRYIGSTVAGICLHFVFIQISQTHWACMKCFIGSGRYLFTFCIHTDFTDTLGLHAVFHWKWQVSVYILYSYRSHRHTGLALQSNIWNEHLNI